jgi:hypothetical protein
LNQHAARASGDPREVASVEEILAGCVHPHRREHRLQNRHRLARGASVRVPPAGEALRPRQVLLRHVQPAGMSDPAIENRELPVASIAERVQLIEGRERLHPDAVAT